MMFNSSLERTAYGVRPSFALWRKYAEVSR